ncbi:DUF4190 domain-containing protein [Glycomyces sp. L485]|uniref:DUF4190 domain-containing protein n=1 Tax=Glycomyces sp. L485 TaxID=2909235 RepID=UPI001F4B552C|nr:DUF4190 domain-containing protein [Glycomyces sp. L485]MCH7231045.1 DUF4190 domain-containing protein [Glycomyces sp. L485]
MAYTPDPASEPVPQRTNGHAVTALVLGILALVLAFIPLVNVVSFVLGPLAIIFGIVGLVAGRRRGTGKGMSIAGIVMGALALVIGIVMYVLVFNVASEACEDEGYSGNVEECLEELQSELPDSDNG